MCQRRLEQGAGSLDIGLDEIGRTIDRPVDMRFRRKVQYGIGIKFAEQCVDHLPIANIGSAKYVTGARFDRPQRTQIRRIGQLINI
jgi:hypothetical protein